jgi:drug/metabolite transporter (DMT)-like permease
MDRATIALVLSAALMHALWNVLLRGGRDRFWAASIMSLAAGLPSLAAIPFLPLPAASSWPFLLGSSTVHVVYNLLLVRMYREGDFGHTYPVARGSSPLLIALGGLVFAGEQLRASTFAGVALVSVGILALAVGGSRARAGGALAALATGSSIAVYSLVDGLGVRRSGNAAAYTAWMVLGYGIAMPLVFVALRREGWPALWRAPGREIAKAAGGGLVSVAGYAIVIWAMEHGPMGPVSALRETSVLFAALLGKIFLREPFTRRKACSAAVIAAGAALLRWAG